MQRIMVVRQPLVLLEEVLFYLVLDFIIRKNSGVMESTRDRLVKFFKPKLGIEINDKTLFFKDIDVSGLDAEMLIQDFVKEFEVDMSLFQFNDYFDDVPFLPLSMLFKKVFKRNGKKVLTLDDLIEIVESGKWEFRNCG